MSSFPRSNRLQSLKHRFLWSSLPAPAFSQTPSYLRKRSLRGRLPLLLQLPTAQCALHLCQSRILPLPLLLLSMLLPLSLSRPHPCPLQPPNHPSALQSSPPLSHLSDHPSQPRPNHLLPPQSALSPLPYQRLAHLNLPSTLTALFALSQATPSPRSVLSLCHARSPRHPSPLTLPSELSLSPESLPRP